MNVALSTSRVEEAQPEQRGGRWGTAARDGRT